MVADVTTQESSIRDALVATDCGNGVSSARRSDEDGRARVKLWGSVDAKDCIVTVAKPGYTVVESKGANICSSAEACPPTRYILEPIGGAK